MEQRLSVQETGQLFATVVVQVPAGSRTPEFVLTTPLGLFLPAGVKLAVDGSPFLTLPVRNCDGNGCCALAALSDANISMLKQGGSMNVALQNLANQAVKFDVSLIGFSAAFDGIK
jgi:invasion protein IalB